MEAWRRELDGPVSAFPIAKAGPAHIATLKTFDPPLAELEGRKLSGAERRAKRLLFPTQDGELVLLVHLMTAGRLRYVLAGDKRPQDAGLPTRVRGGRGADPHRGRQEEARRRLAARRPTPWSWSWAHLGPEANESRRGAVGRDPAPVNRVDCTRCSAISA